MDLSAVLMAAAEKSKEKSHINECDYQLDGLWYCGKCHTRKQSYNEYLGKSFKHWCLCKCATEERDREREEFELRQLISQRRSACFSYPKMANWTFANDDGQDEKTLDVMKRYCDRFQEIYKKGKGLLLYGSVGTGKTYSACQIANELIDNGYSAHVTSFSKISNKLMDKYGGKEDYISWLCSFDLLVIDDLSAERKGEYMREVVFEVIDARCRSGKPLIITTNLDINDIKNSKDVSYGRIYDRILQMCFPYQMNGRNKRHREIRESYGEMKNLLGLNEQ